MPNRGRRLIALLAMGTLALAGCGSDDTTTTGEDTGGTPTTAGGGGGGELSLIRAGTLTVCSDMPYEPFEFEVDGETTGFDYDVVAAMAEELDLDVEFKTTPFDGILAALAAGECDMVASAMTITDERAEQVDFTDPYFDADQSLLIRAEDEGTYAGLDDLGGRTIGVQSGTTGADYANENKPDGATVREYQTGDEMFPALIAGEIDAALQDFPVNAYRAAKDDTLMVTESFPTGEQYGFAVAKGSTALLDALNEALAAIRADGTYDAIFAEWFGES